LCCNPCINCLFPADPRNLLVCSNPGGGGEGSDMNRNSEEREGDHRGGYSPKSEKIEREKDMHKGIKDTGYGLIL